MNNRIKELAIKSGIVYESEGELLSSYNECTDLSAVLVKFAESLILEACIEVIQPYHSRYTEDCNLVIRVKGYFEVSNET